ncbi:MAG TPA: TIR domain-containing protein [Caulobacteraceae bacterium]|nr:TIR domain-containing protein [Caulobacteraceae bacterium]
MSDIFISYARSTEGQAKQVAEALRGLGYGVWRDDELPAHRDYSEVIEERLRAARAVVVIWSAEAAKSQWVRAEADIAREAGTLVQLTVDGAALPMPFNRIQCADMAGWTGEADHPGWRKVANSLTELIGDSSPTSSTASAEAAAATALPDKPSIAVLAFDNLSNDPDQAYFADGMATEIITALTRFSSLFVIASGSSQGYRGRERNLGQIARELGVRYLLEGSVRRSTNRLRIAAQLADAVDGAQIWAERFDGDLEDVFALQESVATAVAAQIAPSIAEVETRRAVRRPTTELGAYELYLRGLNVIGQFTADKLREATVLADRALDLDATHARSLQLGSMANGLLWIWTGRTDASLREKAVDLGHRGLRAGQGDGEALGWIAYILAVIGEDVESLRPAAERAVALNPGASIAWAARGRLGMSAGRHDTALADSRMGLRLDPRSQWRPEFLAVIGDSLYMLGRYEEAANHFIEAVQLRPTARGYALMLLACYGQLGRRAEAGALRTDLEELRSSSLIFDHFRTQADKQHLRQGLAKAGFES